jgi:CHAD domain-containing protein
MAKFERRAATQGHLAKYLETQSTNISCLAPKVPHHMSGKTVHDLRVAIRRTRAVLWVLRHSSVDIYFNDLERKLRKLGKSLGRVRELNVAIEDAGRYHVDSSQLVARQKNAQKKLRKQIDRVQMNKLIKRLSALEKEVGSINTSFLKGAREDLRRKLSRQLKKQDHGQTDFHGLRITVKKTRYALETMGKPVEPLKRLQDILGDAHDLEVLQAFIGKDVKIKADQRTLNKKATCITKPALRFAVSQL